MIWMVSKDETQLLFPFVRQWMMLLIKKKTCKKSEEAL